MAATAVYSSVKRIPGGDGSVDDGDFQSDISMSKTFTLQGGRYLIAVVGSTFGTVALNVLGPDGSTHLPVNNIAGSAVSFTANGTMVADLAAGSYQLALS